ncbi:hypothetical protein [Actinokineospora diospyrosa]|uniref:HNH/ENDO VII superfamily nuclease n=1 Tax=Actinokineospora diospyrosa TaxID=103728 RepID=A0ABT1IJ60_9PSEU|nr:hypothetical protein [Actinokineospora diospyrosa]MCP2272687.1 hypothetical protein [Actinokineospora diospyrosa]
MFESPKLANPQVPVHRRTAAEREPGTPVRAVPGGASSRAAMLALQRSAGNASVSRLVAANGVVQRTPNEDTPELPITGDARFMLLDQGRYFPLELPDLDKFDIGAGELSTGDLPVAEGIDVRLDIGAHNAPRLADASVRLSPVEVGIAASAIASRRKSREGAGKAEAAVGGVVGGLVGIAAGPLGWMSGLNPISGAEKGGVIGGQLGEWAVDQFSLEARLLSGALSGSLRLLYSPYIRLRVGGFIASKFLDVNATLQTQMELSVTPSVSLENSLVGLHFEKGKLVRSEFSLALEASVNAALKMAGILQLGATLLHFIDNETKLGDRKKIHDDPGLLTLNILSTDVFPIVDDLEGTFTAKTKLDLLKASPLALTGKHFTAQDDAVRNMVVRGFKDNLSPAIAKSRSSRKGKGTKPRDDGPRYHTGTYRDPVPIIWFKPFDVYPDELPHHGGPNVRKFPHQEYADGLEAGVDALYWPWTGKKFKKEHGTRAGGGTTVGQAKLADAFEQHGVDIPEGAAQIDHVLDDFLGGPDEADNLWPLATRHNQAAGLKHGHQGVRYQPSNGPEMTAPTAVHNVPAGVWFIISQQLQPADPIPDGGAPEHLG